MKLFYLTSAFLSTICLATKRQRESKSSVPDCIAARYEIDSLKDIIMKEYPEVLPPFLVTFKNWDRDVANAFAVGLALSKQCNSQKDTSINSSADNPEKKCAIFRLVGGDIWETVVMEELRNAVSANSEWKDGDKAFSPFAELFDIHEIEKSELFNEAHLYPEKVRLLFAKYAKNATAMIAIDVAILKWLVHAIKTKIDSSQVIRIDKAIIMPLCALSMIPLVQEHCTNDILTILTQKQQIANIPSYLTLFKLLDAGVIKEKVEEILLPMWFIGTKFFLNACMILGKEHQFVQKIKVNYSKDKHTSMEALLHLQTACQRKVYSFGHVSIDSYKSNCNLFRIIDSHTKLGAYIKQDNTLNWEKPLPTSGSDIYFENRPSPHPQQVSLLVISQVPAPVSFWQTMTSCTSLTIFQEILTRPQMRQMILTYGITIMEDNSVIKFMNSIRV